MKVALLISGEPRFCTDFDQFISQLKNYDQIDFFFYLWSNTPEEESDKRWNVVADFWRSIDVKKARNKIEDILKNKKFNIIEVEVFDRHKITIPTISNKASETNVRNVWHMHTGWYNVNQLKKNYELKNNSKYDVVINGRLDIKLNKELDLNIFHKTLNNNKNCVYTPIKPLYGKLGHSLNDQLAIGSSESIDVYTNLVNKNYSKSIIFHPETLLSFHLKKEKILDIKFNFDISLRNNFGPTKDDKKSI